MTPLANNIRLPKTAKALNLVIEVKGLKNRAVILLFSVGLIGLLKAGLLTSGSSFPVTPSRLNPSGLRYQTPLLQWRDRTGLTPVSLLSRKAP